MKVKLLLNVSNLLKDGKVVMAGTVLELDDEQAKRQISRGLMVKVVDMVPVKKEGLVSKMLKEKEKAKDKEKTKKIKKKK